MLATVYNNTPSKIGLEITDLNLANIADFNSADIAKLLDAYNQEHLLIIRNQKLNEEQLVQISRLFSEPTPALVPTHRLENYPVITRHTNKKDQNRVATGVVAPEYVFHSDSYFTCNPSKATLFYCLKAPKIGGETQFINMCDVYDGLSESTKKFIADKKVLYKNAFINQPPVEHPLVRVHPVTKRKALYVNKNRVLGINGLDEKAALLLTQNLYHFATLPEFVYEHKWHCGDLLIWNNPTTMHCATPIPDSEERLLYRILTKGDMPVS